MNKVFFLQPWYDTRRFFVQSQATVQRFPNPFIREYPLAEYFARDFVEESVKKKKLAATHLSATTFKSTKLPNPIRV